MTDEQKTRCCWLRFEEMICMRKHKEFTFHAQSTHRRATFCEKRRCLIHYFIIIIIIVEMVKFCTKNEIASHAKSSASEEAIVHHNFLYVNISFYRILEASTLP